MMPYRMTAAMLVLATGGLTSLAGQAHAQQTAGGVVKPGRLRPEAGRANSRSTLKFRDETGRERPLAEFFGRRPVILAPVYFRCPLLCNQLLEWPDPQPEAGVARLPVKILM